MANAIPEKYRPIESGVAFEEFLHDLRFDSRHVEWVDGEVFEKPSVTRDHSLTVVFLISLISMVAETQKSGKVLGSPFVMHLEEQKRGRAPDILLVKTENLARIEHMKLCGPADLVVEVISPGTVAIERGTKFDEYEAAGVGEYWIIDPDRGDALFYAFQDGLFRPLEKRNGIVQSAMLGEFDFRIEWLWEQPRITDVLREWNLI